MISTKTKTENQDKIFKGKKIVQDEKASSSQNLIDKVNRAISQQLAGSKDEIGSKQQEAGIQRIVVLFEEKAG